jgi:alkanesulfonate monooxygenase SsuD/methylene tetrahydromethanopterin reductase-like flavin-dependent oxidoreductase (luciferase family)
VSDGRVELGLGAGWYEAEHVAYGFPFPRGAERLDELERQLETVVRHWTEDREVWPKPLQQPHPPLIVGGKARPRTVAAAVRFADEYNTLFATPETCSERRRAVAEACERAGREPLRYSLMTGCVVGRDEREVEARRRRFAELAGGEPGPEVVVGTVERAAERLREYERAGVERVMLQHLAHEDVDMVGVLGEVAAAVAQV